MAASLVDISWESALTHCHNNKVDEILQWYFQSHFLDRDTFYLIKISLKLVPKRPINNMSSLELLMFGIW